MELTQRDLVEEYEEHVINLKEEVQFFPYIFPFFYGISTSVFYPIASQKNYPLWWSELIVSKTELQCGGWVPEDVQELPLLAASS